jgi:hypothetical protein
VPPAAFDGGLRFQCGLWEAVQARVYGVHALILCGQLHRPNVFQDSPKIRLRCEAHGSISVQEGQPYTSLMTVYFQFPRSPELSRYFRALASRQTHRGQPETPNAWMWGANGRRVSRGRIRSGIIERSSRKLWAFRRRNRRNVAAHSSPALASARLGGGLQGARARCQVPEGTIERAM